MKPERRNGGWRSARFPRVAPDLRAVPGSSEFPVFDRSAGSALRARQTERFAISIQKTIHRTYNNALRLVKVAYALIAFVGVDNKNIITFRYFPGWADRRTKTANDKN